MLLTSAIGAGYQTIDISYDIPALGQVLDLLNVMTYDYHGSWDNVTGVNAPLYPQPDRWSVVRLTRIVTRARFRHFFYPDFCGELVVTAT